MIPAVPRESPHLAFTPAGATYEYVGRTALTVDGPVSRRRYRFDRAGARAEVDVRDAPALARIPVLRRVR